MAIHPVILVGAGPGDPGLLTVRGREALERAEVVVADRLVAAALLPTRAGVEVIVRGALRRDLPQHEINLLLIERARQGKRVVRLKGGDPFVFGRGGEEAEALRDAGIAFEMVPGVTAAIAAPEYAGIPVTHRGLSGAVAFVTGQETEDKEGGGVDWEMLATGAVTLVAYMSVSHLPRLVERLLGAGVPASRPVAIIERGTMNDQRTTDGTLGDIVERARAAGVKPPALTVVGEVVRMRERLRWFEGRPLQGRRMLAVAARGDRGEGVLADEALQRCEESLRGLGLELSWGHPLRIVHRPESLAPAMEAIGRFRSIAFTSIHGVHAFAIALESVRLDGRALSGARIASLAGRTVAAIRQRLALRADIVVEGGGKALAEALLARGAAGPVLFPRAAEGREELPGALTAAGEEVETVAAYESVVDQAEVAAIVGAAAASPFDAVAFASPRAVSALLDGGLRLEGTIAGAIGATTARALEERGVEVGWIASRPAFPTLLEELGAVLARPREIK